MDQIENYKIIAKIGEGGMGEVYRGVDVMLEREVAIKLLRPELSRRDDVVQRFRSEAIALGRLNHPNIAAVYNFGCVQDQYYIALEFVNGETLDSIIKKNGLLPWRVAVDYAVAVLEGLDHAHRQNIVHRDIKPANLMVTENNMVKILDFGIARILEKTRLTKDGHMVGTLEYVSPEQVQGRDTDKTSDIYSLGVVLYEMLTGHIPFEKNTEYDLIRSHIEEKPKFPGTFSNKIPVALEHLVLRALEKKPDKRFNSAKEFGKALSKLADNLDDEAINDRSPLIKFCLDYPGIVFLLSLLIIGGEYFLLMLNHPPERSVATPIISGLSKPIAGLEIANDNPKVKLQSTDEINEKNKLEVKNELLPPPEIIQSVLPTQAANTASTAAKTKSPSIKNNSQQKLVAQHANPKVKPQESSPADPGIDKAAESFFRN